MKIKDDSELNGFRNVKVTYEETYRNLWLRKDKLPQINHLTPAYEVDAAEVLKAGQLEDGREFQTIRIIIKEKG